jgi:peptidoglycan hydrolase-like protein with peptidoglycan-binding domain
MNQGDPKEVKALTSTELTELQTLLSHRGLYPKNRIDGIYGPMTQGGWNTFKESIYQKSPELIGAGSIAKLLKTPKLPSTNSLIDRAFRCCVERGYTLDQRPGAINIIGIEGVNLNGTPNNDAPDRWNDLVGIMQFDAPNQPKWSCLYVGTTEPGRYYTLNPLNRGGAARLQLGQHKQLWAVGQHRGYEAMQQVGVATLVRDSNHNFLRDDRVTREAGNGINLHTTKTTGWRGAYNTFISTWSAGCVLIRDPNEFLSFMRLVKASTQYKSSRAARFDFTLLWKDWL